VAVEDFYSSKSLPKHRIKVLTYNMQKSRLTQSFFSHHATWYGIN